jgi:integrase
MSDHLERRGEYYYAHLQIPKDLKVAYGKVKIRKALGTTDRRVAKLKAMEEVLAWKKEFEHLRSVNAGSLSPAAIEQDLRAFYQGVPDEEPVLNDNGKVDWVLVDKNIEVASYAWDQYEPDKFDRFALDNLAEAVDVVTGKLVRLSDYVDGWLDQWGASPKTKDMGKRDVLMLLSVYPYMHSLKRSVVKKYLRNLDVSEKTKKRYATFWNGFWNYVNVELEIEEPREVFTSLFEKAKRVKQDRQPWDRFAFTVAEVELLHNAAKGQDLKDLIKIAAYTGFRIEEACQLAEVENEWFVVSNAKTAAGNRRVPIHPALKDGTLDRWLITRATFAKNKYGDRSNAIGKRFGRLKNTFGFKPEYVFHSLRHTFATELVSKFPDKYLIVSQLLGHVHDSSNQTLSTYAHARDDNKADLVASLSYKI